MTIAISAATPSSATQAAPAAKAPQAESIAKPSARLQPDTVKLSPAAQAKMMHRAGQSLALIAATLGTDVGSINGYLGIKVAAQPPTMPADTLAPSAAPSAQLASAEPPVPVKG